MKPICVTSQILSQPKWKAHIQGKYVIQADTGCWEWTGAIDRYGYGLSRITIGGRKRHTGAHRASWIAHRGPILDNLQLDHLCRNRICINPFHLEPVTTQENTRRAATAGAYLGNPKMGRPHIPLDKRNGCGRHGFDDGNWNPRKDGYTVWNCRVCARERMTAWKARNTA